MKNKFNVLRKYILENSVKEYRKETINGLFRSILSPLLLNQKINSCILLRINNIKEKESIIKRLIFSDADIFSYNNNLEDFNIKNSQNENLWDNTEFVIVLSQRYSAALMWDWDLSETQNSTNTCLFYNSKIISDIAKKISENSVSDVKTFIQNYSPDRRENLILNSSISEIVSLLNDKNEEIVFSEQEKKHILSDNESLKIADIVSQKAKYTAHEIKNNLSVINLYSAIAKKRFNNISTDEETTLSIQNAFNNILSASENISSIISDLRCLSAPYKTEISIKNLIINTVDMCKEKANKAKVNLVIDNFDDYIIKTDKTKVQCALTNIIFNAIEACDENCIVNISCFKEEEYIKIQIKNNGKKIPENIINKIFEPEFTTKEKGNGLGLYICKKQLEQTGGTINLVISNDKETVFEVILPV